MDVSRKVYLEYVPDGQAVVDVLALLRTTVGRPVPAGELHLTLIHIGMFKRLIADLRRYKTDVDERRCMDQLQIFIDRAPASMPSRAVFYPRQLQFLGPGHNVLALVGEGDPTLRQAHKDCLELTRTMLRACLKRDPEEFMAGSPNFRFAASFKPHITLLRECTTDDLPAVTLPSSIGLRVLPPEHDLKQGYS